MPETLDAAWLGARELDRRLDVGQGRRRPGRPAHASPTPWAPRPTPPAGSRPRSPSAPATASTSSASPRARAAPPPPGWRAGTTSPAAFHSARTGDGHRAPRHGAQPLAGQPAGLGAELRRGRRGRPGGGVGVVHRPGGVPGPRPTGVARTGSFGAVRTLGVDRRLRAAVGGRRRVTARYWSAGCAAAPGGRHGLGAGRPFGGPATLSSTTFALDLTVAVGSRRRGAAGGVDAGDAEPERRRRRLQRLIPAASVARERRLEHLAHRRGRGPAARPLVGEQRPGHEPGVADRRVADEPRVGVLGAGASGCRWCRCPSAPAAGSCS